MHLQTISQNDVLGTVINSFDGELEEEEEEYLQQALRLREREKENMVSDTNQKVEKRDSETARLLVAVKTGKLRDSECQKAPKLITKRGKKAPHIEADDEPVKMDIDANKKRSRKSKKDFSESESEFEVEPRKPVSKGRPSTIKSKPPPRIASRNMEKVDEKSLPAKRDPFDFAQLEPKLGEEKIKTAKGERKKRWQIAEDAEDEKMPVPSEIITEKTKKRTKLDGSSEKKFLI